MQSLFKTKEGGIVIAQTPNLPIIVWFIAFLAAKIPMHKTLVQFFDLLSFGAIFTWAWLEIFQGVNAFRRLLGLVVASLAIYFRLM